MSFGHVSYFRPDLECLAFGSFKIRSTYIIIKLAFGTDLARPSSLSYQHIVEFTVSTDFGRLALNSAKMVHSSFFFSEIDFCFFFFEQKSSALCSFPNTSENRGTLKSKSDWALRVFVLIIIFLLVFKY